MLPSSPSNPRALVWVTAATVLAGAVLWGGSASAHPNTGDHGRLTFHQSRDAPPVQDEGTFEDPVRLECQFWIRGHGMTHASGILAADHNFGPSAHRHLVAAWNGTENASGGFDLEVGPLALHEDDTYALGARMGETGHSTRVYAIEYLDCEDETKSPSCPAAVQAQALPDERVRLTWYSVGGRDGGPYRASGPGSSLNPLCPTSPSLFER